MTEQYRWGMSRDQATKPGLTCEHANVEPVCFENTQAAYLRECLDCQWWAYFTSEVDGTQLCPWYDPEATPEGADATMPPTGYVHASRP